MHQYALATLNVAGIQMRVYRVPKGGNNAIDKSRVEQIDQGG